MPRTPAPGDSKRPRRAEPPDPAQPGPADDDPARLALRRDLIRFIARQIAADIRRESTPRKGNGSRC